MATAFSDIPIRANGDPRVVASWWNIIRTALLCSFGSGATAETQFTLPDNTGATDITGLVFSEAAIRDATITYRINRRDDTEGRVEVGSFRVFYDEETTAWAISRRGEGSIGAANGVTFTVVAGTGQVQYATDLMGGASYAGTLKYKVSHTFDKET